MFPFSFGENLGYVLSLSEAFDVRADSASTRIVCLKARQSDASSTVWWDFLAYLTDLGELSGVRVGGVPANTAYADARRCG